MSEPVVAIVGRPNVGKSTLFNRLIQRRQAIVDKQEGITRDRIYGQVEWSGCEFGLIDTGGYIPNDAGVMEKAIRQQVEFAIQEADAIVFLVDGREGVTPADTVLADALRQSGKRQILVVNKIDNDKQEVLGSEFFSLGLDRVISISALGGRKTGDLLDMMVQAVGDVKRTPAKLAQDEIRIAIAGMPNVGKSSIANALLGQEKSIVTEIPGTTRDAIDSRLKYYGKTYVLVDTAGLRKKTRVKENIEYYSALRAHKAIASSDVVVVVIDAVKGFGGQDQRIVREAIDQGKGLILAVNKWDLVQKQTNTHREYREAIKRLFKSLENYSILFVSARTKVRISKILPECETVFNRYRQKIPTGSLNRMIQEATDRYQPPAVKGKNIRIKYATQVDQAPPTIAVFCNFPHLIPESYKNYLENQLRSKVDLTGVPVKLVFKKS